MGDTKRDHENTAIPTDVADVWAAVILDLALKADATKTENWEKQEARDVFVSATRESAPA